MDANLIGKRIAARRSELGLTQEDLAALVKAEQQQISRYERGKFSPRLDVLIEIARALQTSLDWLVGNEITEEDLTPIEMEVVKAMRRARNDQQRKALLNAMKAFTDSLSDAAV